VQVPYQLTSRQIKEEVLQRKKLPWGGETETVGKGGEPRKSGGRVFNPLIPDSLFVLPIM
jgi:hypothetical protein